MNGDKPNATPGSEAVEKAKYILAMLDSRQISDNSPGVICAREILRLMKLQVEEFASTAWASSPLSEKRVALDTDGSKSFMLGEIERLESLPSAAALTDRQKWQAGIEAAKHYISGSTFSEQELPTVNGILSLLNVLKENHGWGPPPSAPSSAPVRSESGEAFIGENDYREAIMLLQGLFDDEGNFREQYQDQVSVALENAERILDLKPSARPAEGVASEPLDYSRLKLGEPCYRCGKVISAPLSHMCQKPKAAAYDYETALLLAAISTASIQNTRESAKERIGRDNPYWTQAYGDVCTAIDREMELRERLEKSFAEITRLSGTESAIGRTTIIEECAAAAEHVTPRHTECGNKIAAAIRKLKHG